MIAAMDTRCTAACRHATTPGCTCTCMGERHGEAHGLPVQMRLGLAAENGPAPRPLLVGRATPRVEPVCAGCGRPEKEAPAAVQIEEGRFCVSCSFELRLWP